MRDGLIGAYVIVAPDAIPAHSSLSALEDGDVGRIVLVEMYEDQTPNISLNRAKLLSSKELLDLNVRF